MSIGPPSTATIYQYARFGELRVFTHGMKPIGSIFPARAVQISWQRNNPGTAQFVVPRNSLRWSTTYVRSYYRVEYHNSYLPVVWTGVIVDIAPSQTEVTVTCQSAEFLYGKRLTDLDFISAQDDTAGMIAIALHNMAVSEESLGIVPGKIYTGSPSYFAQYALDKVSDMLGDLAKVTQSDWWVEKTTHDFAPWTFMWSQHRGKDRWGEVVICGEVTDDPSYKSAGSDMATRVVAIGKAFGQSSSDLNPYQNRMVMPFEDKPSRMVYGLLEVKVEFDTTDDVLLTQLGQAELYKRTQEAKTLALNVDNRRSIWGSFWVGDTVRVLVPDVGYDGLDAAVRVDGIQVDIEGQKMGLAVSLV